MTVEEIIKLERKLLDPRIRKTPEELEALLSSEFTEFASSGRIYGKKATLERLSEEALFEIEGFDFIGFTLAPDIVQLRYRTERKNEDGSKSVALRSSIWIFRKGKWLLLFHQGTLVHSSIGEEFAITSSRVKSAKDV